MKFGSCVVLATTPPDAGSHPMWGSSGTTPTTGVPVVQTPSE